MSCDVTVVGAGLAGCEAALQLAQGGASVRLVEGKAIQRTPAQQSDAPAELVCSNSLRSMNPSNAVGLLKDEMQRLGSFVMDAAMQARVPAGDALAVDRGLFANIMRVAIDGHANISYVEARVDEIPGPNDGPVIIATGPLTSASLAQSIVHCAGHDGFYFYDAIAPIIDGSSIDRSICFAASRYNKGSGDDYLNCPLNRDQYNALMTEIIGAAVVPMHSFEKPKYFEGCLPIEVLAARGPDTLRFGCMKPVGLDDPRTGRWPYAVVQLRREDRDGQAFNIVGFQTKMTHGDQRRIFRLIPGLKSAVFMRLGAMHRNTYLDSPTLLDEGMRLKTRPNIRFAGQITGVEGYVESAAHGLITAQMLLKDLKGQTLSLPPPTTALGALMEHVLGRRRAHGGKHEPQNINWGLFLPLATRLKKQEAKLARVERAVDALRQWGEAEHLALRPSLVCATPEATRPSSLDRRG